jgi:hypothetical protein
MQINLIHSKMQNFHVSQSFDNSVAGWISLNEHILLLDLLRISRTLFLQLKTSSECVLNPTAERSKVSHWISSYLNNKMAFHVHFWSSWCKQLSVSEKYRLNIIPFITQSLQMLSIFSAWNCVTYVDRILAELNKSYVITDHNMTTTLPQYPRIYLDVPELSELHEHKIPTQQPVE